MEERSSGSKGFLSWFVLLIVLLVSAVSASAASAGVLGGGSSGTAPNPMGSPQPTPTCVPRNGPYDIGVVFSDDAAPGKFITYMQADPDANQVVPIDARFATPSLAQLMPYDVVVFFSNTEYDDPVALGDVIADYQDAGGIPVGLNSNWWGPPYGLDGRWMTGGYTMYTYPALARYSTSTLGTYDPTHPLMQGVDDLTAFFRSEVTLTTGATQVAAWADGLPLVAYKTTNGHTAVGINAYLGFPEEGWDGDFGTLVLNAARWLKPGSPCATSTPTATSTSVPPTATDTPPPSTSTSTSTSTPIPTSTLVPTTTPALCAATFTDVLPTDYFYEAVQSLACRGVISGYSDNTFRPYNNVTRAQVCKILVLGFGWTVNTAGGPHFTDVPTDYWAYDYIETVYNRPNEVISGYGDGTFRPGNDMTRGQLSKVIVLSAGWAIDTTGGPHFTDVPESNPFYSFVETARNRGVISGYADNTFRTDNAVTRGQTAKFLYNTLTAP